MCTQHQLEKSRSSPSERASSCETGCHQYRPTPSQLQLHRHSKLSDQLCSILSHTHTAAPRTTSSVRIPRGGPTPAGAGSAGLPPRGRQPAAQRPGGKTDRRPPQPAAAGGGRRAAGTGSRPGYNYIQKSHSGHVIHVLRPILAIEFDGCVSLVVWGHF